MERNQYSTSGNNANAQPFFGFNGSTYHRCTGSEDLPVGYCLEQLWAASRE